MERVAYDEFSMFHENAEEHGIPYDGPPAVRREAVGLGDGRSLSALVWGTSPAELVFLHGGGQNAHTWDTVALALGCPLVAIDLPGHGHSDGPKGGADALGDNADDVAAAVDALAPEARAVVGMSAGGLTALALAQRRPDLVRKLVLVDILPNPDPTMVKRITDFIAGPETFESFDALLERTVAFNPTRSVSSLRRGILHNAVQLDDGTWQWRHRRHRREGPPPDPEQSAARVASLWDAIAGLRCPVMLARGMADGSVITDEQEAKLLAVLPSARVERVEGAGHSIQGDKPVELAALIAGFA
ncbi:MAG TPA: alpha/beta hydrolase [Acidimicrobiales bacterium]|jgi:pimeloyl-ACP methyl ester carboxylesterase|nr:alpha/beta hydrolase [Acidimicrobiales bacterium]